jgi:hypothetical protein
MTEQTNTQPSSKPSKASLPEATLDWFRTNANQELERMRFTPSVQVTLRHQLRATYWATKCQPLTRETVGRACKGISFADTPEGAVPVPMDQWHIDAVLSADQGFAQVVHPESGELIGWSIPELRAQIEKADKAYLAATEARSAKGSNAANVRWIKEKAKAKAKEPSAPTPESLHEPTDPGNPDF